MKAIARIAAVACTFVALSAQAAVVSFTPATDNTAPIYQGIFWNMLSDESGPSSIAGAPCNFNLSGHGDVHYDTANGCSMSNIPTLDGGNIFAPGDEIGPASNWSTWGYVGTYDYNGSMSLGDTAIFGVRFQISGQTHYGWVSITEGADGTHSVNAWGYENIPDTPILAGATGTQQPPAEVRAVPSLSVLNLGLLAALVGVFGWLGRRRRLA